MQGHRKIKHVFMYLSVNGLLWIVFRNYHWTQCKIYVAEVAVKSLFRNHPPEHERRCREWARARSAPVTIGTHFTGQVATNEDTVGRREWGIGDGRNCVTQATNATWNISRTGTPPLLVQCIALIFTASQGFFANFVTYKQALLLGISFCVALSTKRNLHCHLLTF